MTSTHGDEAPARDEALEDLSTGVEEQDADRVHAATDALRERLEAAFEGQAVTQGSLLVERRRRLAEHQDGVDDAAAGDRWEAAREHASAIASLAPRVIQDAQALPAATEPTGAAPRGPSLFRNVLTVARKELVLLLRGTQGLVLFGLLLVTFGIGLDSALGDATVTGDAASVALVWNYAHSLDFLAIPLAGILVGYGSINEEIRSNTIHVLAAQPVSRTGIVLGKFAGMSAALTLTVAASAGLVGGVAYAATGTVGDAGTVLAYPVACLLLAIAFGSIGLVASAVIDRTGPTLATGFGAFILLGPVWQNLFLTRSLEQAGAAPSMGQVLVYLATPFTAWWNWTSELLGPVNQATGLPEGEPWHAALVHEVEQGIRESLPFYATQPYYVLVLLAWIGVTLAATAWVLDRRDLG